MRPAVLRHQRAAIELRFQAGLEGFFLFIENSFFFFQKMFHGFTFDCDLTVVVHALSSARSVRLDETLDKATASQPSISPGFYRVLLGFTEFGWVLPRLTGFD